MTGVQAVPRPETGALGLYARSSDRGGGAIEGGHRAGGGGDRGVRYKLLSVVQRLMFAPGLPSELQSRVCSCHWRRKAGEVELRQDTASGRASYRGLETCRSVWSCPVCNGLITEQRREELQRAVGHWKDQGGECYLVTLTFPHQRRDKLADLVAGMRAAADHFNTSKGVRAARTAAGYVGSIRALEVTWGSWHGWHPHFHLLYFCAPGQVATLDRMKTAWVDALIKSGLAEKSQLNDMLHGADGAAVAFDVQNGDYAADYIAKFGHEPSLRSKIETGEVWGVAREMVKGMSKGGRRLRGVTPFTLLAVVAGTCELRGMTKGRAAALFCEFAAAFKGQRQLYWSPKLRKALQLGRLFTDAELPDLVDAKPEMVTRGVISADDWRLILAHGRRDDPLRALETGGMDAVRALLAELRAKPPPRDDRVSRWRDDGAFADGLDVARAPLPRPGFAVVTNKDGSTRNVFEGARR